MAEKKPNVAYGTELAYTKLKSNHPIKSRYMAASLAMVFGIIGANQFYLHNFVRGLLKLVLSAVCIIIDVTGLFPGFKFVLIPIVLSVLTGLSYLAQSDAGFAKKNHVRPL